MPGYTTTASYTKAPVGSLATLAGPDGEEYALVPLDTADGMGMERKGPGNALLLLLLFICSDSITPTKLLQVVTEIRPINTNILTSARACRPLN